MEQFTTHKGEIVTGERLTEALEKVGDAWEANARAIFKEDAYAPHVTLDRRQEYLTEGLLTAQRIREGKETGLTVLQRLNTQLTGECIALLP